MQRLKFPTKTLLTVLNDGRATRQIPRRHITSARSLMVSTLRDGGIFSFSLGNRFVPFGDSCQDCCTVCSLHCILTESMTHFHFQMDTER